MIKISTSEPICIEELDEQSLQALYDKYLDDVTVRSGLKCPNVRCGHYSLIINNRRKRGFLLKIGKVKITVIQLKCKECGSTTYVLLDIMIPYRHELMPEAAALIAAETKLEEESASIDRQIKNAQDELSSAELELEKAQNDYNQAKKEHSRRTSNARKVSEILFGRSYFRHPKAPELDECKARCEDCQDHVKELGGILRELKSQASVIHSELQHFSQTKRFCYMGSRRIQRLLNRFHSRFEDFVKSLEGRCSVSLADWQQIDTACIRNLGKSYCQNISHTKNGYPYILLR